MDNNHDHETNHWQRLATVKTKPSDLRFMTACALILAAGIYIFSTQRIEQVTPPTMVVVVAPVMVHYW